MHAILSHPALVDCRRLFLRDYEIYINIGVHDFEKKAEQRVILNVDLYIPLAMNTPSQDQLDEVVDYDFIRQVVLARIQKGHIHLQETLCDELAKEFLQNPQVLAVQLSTRKPDVYTDCTAVGVEIFKSRQ